MKKNIIVCFVIVALSVFYVMQVSADEKGAMFYRQKVKPLTNLECAKCHYSIFTDIRDMGGAHQMVCMKCHKVFHTFKPGKKWKDVVPNCYSCHNQFHGKAFPNCTKCHANAHAPNQSLDVEKMAQDCRICHARKASETSLHPSEHAKMPCSECHRNPHGYIPDCVECHAKPHTAYTGNSECNVCHPSHSPLFIRYSENTANSVCAGCHNEIGYMLSQARNGHGYLKCAFCHTSKHKYVPTCKNCHKTGPHTKDMLKKFGSCKDCHGNAHSLIVKGPF